LFRIILYCLLIMNLFSFRVFSCTVLFVSISQMIGCEDRLQLNDLDCIRRRSVKLYSDSEQVNNQTILTCHVTSVMYLFTWLAYTALLL